jgi:hypothetical protein
MIDFRGHLDGANCPQVLYNRSYCAVQISGCIQNDLNRFRMSFE